MPSRSQEGNVTSINAIIFVLSRHLETDSATCVSYCLARGYAVAAIVRDDWGAAMKALCTFAASVVVVARLEHLDETCTPRMEVAADMPVTDGPRGERTRLLKRTEGE
jgi:hypothetical protein